MTMIIDTRAGPLPIHTVVEAYRALRKRFADVDDDVSDLDRDSLEEAAYDAFEAIIRSGPALMAWALVLKLLDGSSDDDLGFYAAGPLEDLVQLRGAELVDEIDAEASRNSRFRWALGCVWLSRGDLPDDVLTRIVRASGGVIKPSPPLADEEA